MWIKVPGSLQKFEKRAGINIFAGKSKKKNEKIAIVFIDLNVEHNIT